MKNDSIFGIYEGMDPDHAIANTLATWKCMTTGLPNQYLAGVPQARIYHTALSLLRQADPNIAEAEARQMLDDIAVLDNGHRS